jgi:hypothetical protein
MPWITSVVALLLVPAAAAAQTVSVIYLSCDGTMQRDTADTREQVTKLGLVINYAEHTVVGFGIAARVDQVDASSIEFSGEGPIVEGGSNIGTVFAQRAIDRVTGIVSATTTQMFGRGDRRVLHPRSARNWTGRRRRGSTLTCNLPPSSRRRPLLRHRVILHAGGPPRPRAHRT